MPTNKKSTDEILINALRVVYPDSGNQVSHLVMLALADLRTVCDKNDLDYAQEDGCGYQIYLVEN